MSKIEVKRLDNNLTLLVEPMPGVASAAFSWKLPVGAAADPENCVGESALLNEFIFRGAAKWSAREHSDALDRLGIQRSNGVGTHHLTINAVMLGSNVLDSFPLLSPITTELSLQDDGFEPAKSLCLQTIESLSDDPQHFAMLHLRERQLPAPFNRHGYGDVEGINAASISSLRDAWKNRCVPDGTLLGIAGAVDVESITSHITDLFSDWQGKSEETKETAESQRGILHVEEPTAQVHIGVAYDAPREADENSMLERLAIGVLSGGMSGRLFTEVRERRSLCYSVHASYAPGRDRGVVSLYSGTTPERAQETLDVCIEEVRKMTKGVTEDEFNRAVVGLKSRLVMQGESTSARAAAITRDQFCLGRPRTLNEIAAAVDAVTIDQLNSYLSKREFGELTVVSIGPTELIMT